MDRHEQLADWLEKVHARSLAVVSGPQDSTLSFYSIHKHVVIVQRWPDENGGWEIYTTPCISNITETLGAVEAMIGIEKEDSANV